MEINSISIDQYVEHEVKLRVMKEVNDERFSNIDKRFDRLESKFDMGFIVLVSLILSSIIFPIVFHALKWI